MQARVLRSQTAIGVEMRSHLHLPTEILLHYRSGGLVMWPCPRNLGKKNPEE